MYCMNCGTVLPDTAKFCNECGTPVKTAVVNNDNIPETIIRQGVCNRVRNIFYVENGHGALTNKRFIYSRHSLAKIAMLGVLTALTDRDYEFCINLSDIDSIDIGRQGVSKILVIYTNDSEVYKFYLPELQRWLNELETLIPNAFEE